MERKPCRHRVGCERGGAHGPMRRFFFSRTASIVSAMSMIEVPPCPRMPAVRGDWICSSDSPESATACCIAMYAYLQLSPMKRNLTLNPYGMNRDDSQKSIMKEVRHRKVGLKQHDASQSLVLPSIIQRGSSMVLSKKRSIHEVNFQEQQSTKPIVEIEPDLHNIL